MAWILFLTAMLFCSIGFVAGCVWQSLPWEDDEAEPPIGI